jgi:hypothetical protein
LEKYGTVCSPKKRIRKKVMEISYPDANVHKSVRRYIGTRSVTRDYIHKTVPTLLLVLRGVLRFAY